MATKLDMAEQQLLGFNSAKQGETLIGLVIAMGLTPKEWKELKEDNAVYYLDGDEVREIDNYFEGRKGN